VEGDSRLAALFPLTMGLPVCALLLLLSALGAQALPFGDGKPAMGFNT